MNGKRRTPAIFAGLAGCGVWSIPLAAQAAPVNVTINDLLGSPLVYFALGCVAGAAVAGTVTGVAAHRTSKRLQSELDQLTAHMAAESAAADAAAADAAMQSLDVSEAAQPAEPVAEVQPAEPVGQAEPVAEAQPAEPVAEAQPESQTAELQTAEPSAEEEQTTASLHRVSVEEGTTASLNRRQVAAAVEKAEAAASEAAAPEAATPQGTAPAPVRRVSARLDALLPKFDDASFSASPAATVRAPIASALVNQTQPAGAVSVPDSAQTAQQEAMQAAREYVRTDFEKRKRSRARGVRAILAERLGGGMMEGLPVIERADGSVGDVGTSWWDNTMDGRLLGSVDNTANLKPVSTAQDPLATAALRRAELERAARNAQYLGTADLGMTRTATAAWSTADLSAAARSASIANRVANVEQSLFPEHREEEPEVDTFEQAMRAMDAEMPPVGIRTAADAAAEVSMLDATNNLQTGAVVTPERSAADLDAEAYVDRLVQEEIERNRAGRARRYSRSFLTVFEGTGDLSDVRKIQGAKHLAREPKEKEA